MGKLRHAYDAGNEGVQGSPPDSAGSRHGRCLQLNHELRFK